MIMQVLHCPYCHGYEFGGQRLGVLYASPVSLHQAALITEWGPTTLYLNGADMPDDDASATLARRGVAIEPAPVAALHGEGRSLSAIVFADGRTAGLDALFLGPNDLSGSVGRLGQYAHPDVAAEIARAEAALFRTGKPIGTVPHGARGMAELLAAGYAFLGCSADVTLLRDAARAEVAAFRRLSG